MATKSSWGPKNLASSADLSNARDKKGRFLTGNSGGGRPKGARNKITNQFIEAVADDFADHGADAIVSLRDANPEAYLKLIAAFIPRSLVLQKESEPDFANMTDDEVEDLMWELQRSCRFREAYDALTNRK